MINGSLVDRFTLAHLAAGYVLGGYFGVNTVTAIAVAWEILERPAKRRYPQWFPHATQDTPRNMIGDVVAMRWGARLAK